MAELKPQTLKDRREIPPNMPDDQYLTEHQVAALTQMGVQSLRNNRSRKRGIPFIKLGKSVRYRLQDVRDWMDAHLVVVEW